MLKGPPKCLLRTFFEGDPSFFRPQSKSATVVGPSVKSDEFKITLIDDKYFQIGSKSADQVFCTLSVTICFVENLLSLFPDKSLWPSENIEFRFKFTLFGFSITMEPFNNLRNPVNIAEKATVNMLSSPSVLLKYLKKCLPILTVYLFCDDITVAKIRIPIGDHIDSAKKEKHILEELHSEDFIISNIYPMESSFGSCSIDVEPLKPQAGISVNLSRCHQFSQRSQSANKDVQTITIGSDDSSDSQGECSENRPPLERNSPSNLQAKIGKQHAKEAMYLAACELELWKEEQKILEGKKLEEQCSARVKLLDSVYIRHFAINEVDFQKRMGQIIEMEEQYAKGLGELDQKKEEVKRKNEHLDRLRAQILGEKRQVAAEVERVTARLEKEYDFKLQSERKRHTMVVNELRQRLNAKPRKDSLDELKRIAELEAELEKKKADLEKKKADLELVEREKDLALKCAQKSRESQKDLVEVVQEQSDLIVRMHRYLSGQYIKSISSQVAVRQERSNLLKITEDLIAKSEKRVRRSPDDVVLP